MEMDQLNKLMEPWIEEELAKRDQELRRLNYVLQNQCLSLTSIYEKNVGLEEKLKKSKEENVLKDQQLLIAQKKVEMLTVQVQNLLGNESSTSPTPHLDSFIELGETNLKLEHELAKSNMEKAKLEEKNMRLGHELLTRNQEKAKLEEQLFKVEKRKASQEELLLVVQKRIHELERGQKTKICNPATHSKGPTTSNGVSKPSANKRKKSKSLEDADVNKQKKGKLEVESDEEWLKNLLFQNYAELIKSTLRGSRKPLNLDDLLNAIPCKNKDKNWRNSMTAVIKSNKFSCSPEGYYSERPSLVPKSFSKLRSSSHQTLPRRQSAFGIDENKKMSNNRRSLF